MYKAIIHLVLLTIVLMLSITPPVAAADTWTDVIPGVRHLHRITSDPWDIHVMLIDLTNPRIRLRSVIKNDNDKSDSGEIVRSACVRYNAVVGINTDFFCASGCSGDAHCPQGQCVTDGIVWYSPGRSGPIASGRSSLLISSTGAVSVGVTTTPGNYYNIVAGGPRNIRDGVVGSELEPGLPTQTVLAPRTGAAITQDGKTLILATVDGRQASSRGMNANEMGTLMKEFGGYQGLDFDSGGSTTMVLNGATINHPSDGSDRLVAGSLVVIDRLAQGSNPTVSYEASFEPPLYPAGSISGIDGWVGSGTTATGGRAGQCVSFSNASAYRNVPGAPLSQVQWVECYAKSSAANRDCSIYAGTEGANDVAAAIKLNSLGKIQALDGDGLGGGTWKTIQSYSSNAYYRIGIRLDYYINSYQLYVDGILKASGLAFRDIGAIEGLGAVKFEQIGGSSTFSIDDVYIGNVDMAFPRVSPDRAVLVSGTQKQFRMMGGTSPNTWRITDERNVAGTLVASGTVATISSSGVLTAASPGSCIVHITDSIGREDNSTRIYVTQRTPVRDLKTLSDGSCVATEALTVSAVFNGSFYAQQDVPSGIKVITSKTTTEGSRIYITGWLDTVNGERVIRAESMDPAP